MMLQRLVILGSLVVCTASADSSHVVVSGCTDAQAVVVAAASDEALGASIGSAEGQYMDAYQSSHQARQSLRTLGWTAEREAGLASAEASLAVAKQALATAQTAYDEALLESLAEQVGADNALLAQRAMANAHRNVPVHYKVLELSEPGWKALESALQQQAEADEDGQQPTLTDAQAAALSAANASATVALAKQRIATNGPAIEAALGQYYKQQAQASD